jgi:hypothetical protein
MNPILPHNSSQFQFISSKNDYNNEDDNGKKVGAYTVTYKFKWKDQKYRVTWVNPKGVISVKDQYIYTEGQIDKIILLIERYLYGKEKSLKCSLDLKTVKTIEKKTDNSEKESKAKQTPFDFDNQAVHLKAKIDDPSTKNEDKASLNDKLAHAKLAAELKKKAGVIPDLNLDEKDPLAPLGDLKIEKKEDEKTPPISYGFLYPLKWLADFVADFFESIIKRIVQFFSK